MNLSEAKDFVVSTASLKEVRDFCREIFDKINLPQEQKDELVLAIAEAAQNIVKHGYKGVEETTDRMEIKISLKDIKTNWKSLNEASNGNAAAVVKANAYGMGMLKVVEALIEAGCFYFYVANIHEALKLRKKFNTKKISIAVFEGYLDGNQKIYAENNLIPILNSLEQVKRLKKYVKI